MNPIQTAAFASLVASVAGIDVSSLHAAFGNVLGKQLQAAVQNNHPVFSTLKVDYQKLQVTDIAPDTYRKAADGSPIYRATLKQVAVVHYPTGNLGMSSLNDKPTLTYGMAAGATVPRPSTRTHWMPLIDGLEAVLLNGEGQFDLAGAPARLQKWFDTNQPNAGLQRVMSSVPILSVEQANGIASGRTSLQVIGYGQNGTGGQLLRYPADATDGTASQPILHNGKEQFSIYLYRNDITQHPDVDIRSGNTTVNRQLESRAETAPQPSAQPLPASTFEQQVSPAALSVLPHEEIGDRVNAAVPAAQPVTPTGEDDLGF